MKEFLTEFVLSNPVLSEAGTTSDLITSDLITSDLMTSDLSGIQILVVIGGFLFVSRMEWVPGFIPVPLLPNERVRIGGFQFSY